MLPKTKGKWGNEKEILIKRGFWEGAFVFDKGRYQYARKRNRLRVFLHIKHLKYIDPETLEHIKQYVWECDTEVSNKLLEEIQAIQKTVKSK